MSNVDPYYEMFFILFPIFQLGTHLSTFWNILWAHQQEPYKNNPAVLTSLLMARDVVAPVCMLKWISVLTTKTRCTPRFRANLGTNQPLARRGSDGNISLRRPTTKFIPVASEHRRTISDQLTLQNPQGKHTCEIRGTLVGVDVLRPPHLASSCPKCASGHP